MKLNRRHFLSSMLGTGLMTMLPIKLLPAEEKKVALDKLQRAATSPVLRKELFPSPVIIDSVELLRNDEEYLVRIRSRDGAVGLVSSHSSMMKLLYPVFLKRVAPFFIDKDARDLDSLLDGVYVHKSNYKLQGLALWICVASIEFAILDMLGQISGKSVGELLGSIVRRDIDMYRANNYRDKTAEKSVARMVKRVKETGVKAIKFKIGGRMSNNADSLPGRTEALIPLVRKTFGDDMVLYADSNGSYDYAKGVEIGRLLEEYDVRFYEEPCPFDHLEETKRVADALTIPIAGGEQESSMRRFRWMIHNNALQVVQPDLFYFGGFTRAVRVARMAAAAGMSCIPHISGISLGYLYVIHFASFVPNADLHMEFKGQNEDVPVQCDSSSLDCKNGTIRVPSGPGFGITIDPDYVKAAELITA